MFSSRHALLCWDTSSEKALVWGGSECSGSSGCFQVHTASWFQAHRGESQLMLPFWDPDCRNIDSSFSPHLTFITLSQNREVVEFQSITLYIQPTPHTVLQKIFYKSVAVLLGEESLKGHSGGFACFRPLTTNCIYMESMLDVSVAYHQV